MGTPQAMGPKKDCGLAPGELLIVAMIVAGYSDSEIAQKLLLSEHSVQHSLTRILAQLGVSDRLELALFASDRRLVGDLSSPSLPSWQIPEGM